jgi:hypothetical protein
MFNRGSNGRIMSQGQFTAVSTPSKAEGVGRALQSAFRDGYELPTDMLACLDRLNRIPV